MAGFFLTFIPITICIAWSQYLAPRLPFATWVPLVGCLLWCGALGLAMTGLAGSDADLAIRVERITDAARYAQWASIGTVVAMVPITAVAFMRPAKATDAA